MTRLKFHTSIVVFLLIGLIGVIPTAAQKKKKTDETTTSSSKLREAEFYFTEAEKFFILEDYSKALAYYQRTLEVSPENATVHYKIAEVLARSNKQEDLQRAASSIEQALRIDKTNKYFYVMAASIYRSLAKFDKATAVYEEMIRTLPGTEEYLYDLAEVLQYANKQEEAIKVYTRAENVFGVNELSSTQKIKLYLEADKTKEAISEGEKLIAAFPEEERYVMAFAQVLSQKNLTNVAIQYLEKYTSDEVNSGNAKMFLAGLYRDTNQEVKARPLLLSLFDDPSVEFGGKLIILGAYNAELNQSKSTGSPDTEKEKFAVSLLEKLKKNYPEESGVHILGGDLYLAVGKDRESQSEYAQAVKGNDVNFEVWENLLYLDIKLEQYDQAVKHSEQALELFPNQGMLHYFSGIGNLRKRRYAESISALEQSKKMLSAKAALVADINALLGEAYNANKEYEKSDKAYDEALLFNPSNYSVLNNYSYFLALRKGNLEKAEKMSALLVKNNPENPTFLDTHAWVLYVREKYREARRVIEKAISTGKASAIHFEHYGDILYKLGDVEGAVAQWEKAKGMNANSEILNKKIANRKIYE